MITRWRENPVIVKGIQIFTILMVFCMIGGIYLFLFYFPLPTTPYNRALIYYRNGAYQDAIDELASLPARKKNADVDLLLAWSLFKIREYRTAHKLFKELLEKDPDLEEAKVGLAEVALADNSPEIALGYIKQLKVSKGSNQLILAETYFKMGDNIKAAEIYRTLIEKNSEKEEATKRYLSITGFPEYHKDQQLTLPALKIPKERFIKFRAPEGDYIEIKKEGGWEPIYIKGANLSGALPGHFVTETPQEIKPYLEWFDLMAKMHCNTIRIYNRPYPAFYRALKMHNDSSPEKIWFIQEVWLEERDPDREEEMNVYDLYDPSWTEGFHRELKNAVDVIHGNANIPYVKGRSAGIYTVDVSEYLLAFAIGREVEPYVVQETNINHPAETHYEGAYVTLPKGTPTERWFAEKFDRIAKYEIETYNAEHPLALVSWGPLDGLNHPTEPSFSEENAWSRIYGMELNVTKKERAKGTIETNVVSIDMTHYKATPQFEGGIFATFNIYAHWPQFMYEGYQGSYDEWGHNPYFGYLLDLKKHYKNIPLLIGEYGISTSWAPIIKPEGSFNYGGYSEQEQGDLLKRLTFNVQQAKCAGGLVFEFQDGWWKREVSLYPFVIFSRKPYWYNVMDPQEGYGLQGYHEPLPIPLLRGDKKDWRDATALSEKKSLSFFQNPGDLKRVSALSDSSFFYIRIDVKPWDRPEDIDWNQREYWIGVSTLPGKFGTQLIEDKNIFLEEGINFLIKLNGWNSSEILIAQNYNPTLWSKLKMGSKQEEVLNFKKNMTVSVEEVSPFEKIFFPGIMIHFSKDGKIINPPPIDRSHLHYGTADLRKHQYASLGAWHIDFKEGMIEIRIPWGLLYMMDPSSRLAFGGISGDYKLATLIEGNPLETPGIGVIVLDIQDQVVKNSLPVAHKKNIPSGELPIYSWRKWTMPKYTPYLKASYSRMQEVFENLGVLKS